jgi:hypothetical protein
MSDDVAAALDHENADITLIEAGAIAPASLEPVVGSDPDVTQAQIFNNASGPLPLSAPLTTHGGRSQSSSPGPAPLPTTTRRTTTSPACT